MTPRTLSRAVTNMIASANIPVGTHVLTDEEYAKAGMYLPKGRRCSIGNYDFTLKTNKGGKNILTVRHSNPGRISTVLTALPLKPKLDTRPRTIINPMYLAYDDGKTKHAHQLDKEHQHPIEDKIPDVIPPHQDDSGFIGIPLAQSIRHHLAGTNTDRRTENKEARNTKKKVDEKKVVTTKHSGNYSPRGRNMLKVTIGREGSRKIKVDLHTFRKNQANLEKTIAKAEREYEKDCERDMQIHLELQVMKKKLSKNSAHSRL